MGKAPSSPAMDGCVSCQQAVQRWGGRGEMLSAQIRQPALCQLTWSLLHSSSHTKPGFRPGGGLRPETRARPDRGEKEGETEREEGGDDSFLSVIFMF